MPRFAAVAVGVRLAGGVGELVGFEMGFERGPKTLDVERPVYRFLGELQCERRCLGDLVRQLECRGFKVDARHCWGQRQLSSVASAELESALCMY